MPATVYPVIDALPRSAGCRRSRSWRPRAAARHCLSSESQPLLGQPATFSSDAENKVDIFSSDMKTTDSDKFKDEVKPNKQREPTQRFEWHRNPQKQTDEIESLAAHWLELVGEFINAARDQRNRALVRKGERLINRINELADDCHDLHSV
jgi:hypothetical protein